MGIFKKKKVESKVEDEKVVSGVAEVGVGEKSFKDDLKVPEPPKRELTQEERDLLDDIRYFKDHYGQAYHPEDAASLGDPILRAESLSLQFATFAEIRKLNKAIEASLKEE